MISERAPSRLYTPNAETTASVPTSLHNCFPMSTRNGKGAYAGVFLDWVPTRVPPQGSLLDGHVLGK